MCVAINAIFVKCIFLLAQSRVGVLTESGGSVGFLFIDLTATVMQLREAMKKQVRFLLDAEYI